MALGRFCIICEGQRAKLGKYIASKINVYLEQGHQSNCPRGTTTRAHPELPLASGCCATVHLSEWETTGVRLKAGFPPRDVLGGDEDRAVTLGITSGSALTVFEGKRSSSSSAGRQEERPPVAPAPTSSAPFREAAAARTESRSATASQALPASAATASPPRPPPEVLGVSPESLHSLVDMGFPRDFAARALEVAGGDINTALELCMEGTIEPGSFGNSAQAELAGVPAAGRIMIRRIIDADNSCLFNAVGYTLRRKRKVGTELRQMITQAVRGDPFTYTEGILGKAPEDYCRWISDSKSWGGEIELSILSKKLAVMITVVDIQTNNAYSYGEGQGFDRRIFLIYDGVHYDAIAEVIREGAPEEDDVTVFDPTSRDKEDMAKVLAADLKARHQFTDMGNCDLKCMVCFRRLAGQSGALEHARATGHQNFGEA